jgi:hypothetical protein
MIVKEVEVLTHNGVAVGELEVIIKGEEHRVVPDAASAIGVGARDNEAVGEDLFDGEPGAMERAFMVVVADVEEFHEVLLADEAVEVGAFGEGVVDAVAEAAVEPLRHSLSLTIV